MSVYFKCAERKPLVRVSDAELKNVAKLRNAVRRAYKEHRRENPEDIALEKAYGDVENEFGWHKTCADCPAMNGSCGRCGYTKRVSLARAA